MIRTCPICGKEMKSYDIDYSFDGNQNEYYNCENCHHSFKYCIRYHNVWKYYVWEQYYDEKDKCWYDDAVSVKLIVVYQKEK